MDEEALDQYLEQHLSVQLTRDYFQDQVVVRLKVFLKEKVISEDYVHID